MDIGYPEIIKLRECKIVNPELLKGVQIKDVSIDSRLCTKHDLFAAIKGERFDGHDFIERVIKKGVKTIIARKTWFSKYKGDKKKVSFILVNDTINALGELAAIYRQKFIIPVIAVGGSNGKTTSKEFIAHVLSKQYKVLKTKGNYNNAIGVPLTIFKFRKYHEVGVIEVGTNQFGEIANLCKMVQPQFGLLTNLGREHLEYLKDINGVKKEEFELVSYLKNNYGTFFVNDDDKNISRKLKKTEIKKFTYGKAIKNSVSGKIIEFSNFYPKIKIRNEDKEFVTTLSMIGSQSYESAISASAVGFFFEVPMNKIKNAVSEFKIESKKRNELKRVDGYWVIDDTYNSNPDSVKIALENLKQYKVKGKKHIVLGDMLELGKHSKKEHNEVGRFVKKLGFNNLYTYGKESYNTFIGAKGLENNFYFTEKKTLIEVLKNCIKKDDLVLIKGSRSMKMEEIVESINK